MIVCTDHTLLVLYLWCLPCRRVCQEYLKKGNKHRKNYAHLKGSDMVGSRQCKDSKCYKTCGILECELNILKSGMQQQIRMILL